MKTLTRNKSNLKKLSAISCAILSTLSIGSVQADTLSDVSSAISESTAHVQLRYRLETVNQDSKVDNALASTLKSRLTWKSGQVNHVLGLVEIDNVSQLGNDLYNSTNNGNSTYPVVADPKGTDLNQVFLQYNNEGLKVTAGRQRINLQDQRFVGGVGWRQNEQTYDGVRAQFNVSKKVAIDYSYVYNVNRIFGPNDGAQKANWKGDFHFINANVQLTKQQKITGFAYLLDNQDALAASSNTYGIDYSGMFNGISAKLRYATQSDAGNNPNQYTANYYKAELGSKIKAVKVAAGIEVLGSDNGVAFSTPLATLHKFQGFADTFLATPGNGVQDVYVSAASKVNGVTMAAIYHDFSSDKNSMNYGTEVDLVAKYKVNKHMGVLAKFAAYNADELGTDTNKFWLMATMKF